MKQVPGTGPTTGVKLEPVAPVADTDSVYTGELGYDGLNGTRKIGPSYAKSVVYI